METSEKTIFGETGESKIERVRYFPRQLITPQDLIQEQEYFRSKLRRHNRLLHGWGVVCGCNVKYVRPWTVVIEPGYVLGPYGDEIVIDREVECDIRCKGLNGNTVDPCADQLDPWCSDVQVGRKSGRTYYLAVRYDECQARPVRVHPAGCGCDETECEYSRIGDSYAIKILPDLPNSYAGFGGPFRQRFINPCYQPQYSQSQIAQKLQVGALDLHPEPQMAQPPSVGAFDPRLQPQIPQIPPGALDLDPLWPATLPRPCVPCPHEPWVILADLTPEQDGTLRVDLFSHRRYVVTMAGEYEWCTLVPGFPKGIRLLDRTARAAGEPLKYTVVMRWPDGSPASVPIHFDVNPGETFADFLGREGDREFFDIDSVETYALREIYALTEAKPTDTLRVTPEALAPLEGRLLDVGTLRAMRTKLNDLLDAQGFERLERDHLGAPAAARELSATSLVGVSPRSVLGGKLVGMTAGDVANLSRDEFIALAREGVSARRQSAVERQAGGVWDVAKEVAEISRVWRGE